MKLGIRKNKFAIIVAAALTGLAQANAETINITSQFTPLENIDARERIEIQKTFERENPSKAFDWENSIIGKNEHGQIEVRDKKTLMLGAVHEPSCS